MALPRQRIHLPHRTWTRALSSAVKGTLWEGDELPRFEEAFCKYVGAEAAIAVPSGRAGLKFILEGLQLEPGDEVIVPAFTYPIVPAVVKALGLDLRFVDCELTTLGIDPERLAEVLSPRTKAILATHLYGIPCRLAEIREIAEAEGVTVIEDCAHACGAAVDGVKAGALGHAAYFSFETSKCINTLGGGMITTTDTELGERIRETRDAEPGPGVAWLVKRLLTTSLEAVATSPLVFCAAVYPLLRLSTRGAGGDSALVRAYVADDVTVGDRMGRYTNYQAGLGLEQLAQLDQTNAQRRENAEYLKNALGGRVRLQEIANPRDQANYMLVTVLVERLEEVVAYLLRMGIDTKHHYVRDCSAIFAEGKHFPNAACADAQVLHVPAHPGLTKKDLDRVAKALRQAVEFTHRA